jgi:hypothetical protein
MPHPEPHKPLSDHLSSAEWQNMGLSKDSEVFLPTKLGLGKCGANRSTKQSTLLYSSETPRGWIWGRLDIRSTPRPQHEKWTDHQLGPAPRRPLAHSAVCACANSPQTTPSGDSGTELHVPTSGDRRVGSGAAEQATELCGGGRREGTVAAAWVVLGRCGIGTLGGEEEDSIWEIERWRGEEAAGRDENERLSRFFSCRNRNPKGMFGFLPNLPHFA